MRRQDRIGPDQDTYDVAVLTSAALPWMTGPSFISLWHACGLGALGHRVLYFLPWLGARSQRSLWGTVRFASFADQVEWLCEEAGTLGCPPLPDCRPYRAVYLPRLRSIVPLEDVFRAVPPVRALIASEPEHLSWYPLSRGRRHIRAGRTVGLTMTNYDTFIRSSDVPFPGQVARLVAFLHGRALRQRIDLPLSLSPGLSLPGTPMPVERITGISAHFARVAPVTSQTAGAYFLGTFLWEKGIGDLPEIALRAGAAMDVIGGGRDEAALRRLAGETGAPLRFLGQDRRFWETIIRYRVMVNPSRSEVLCTATAEALVAGRHVVLPRCPGNLPFEAYPNAHFYTDTDGAVAALRHALAVLPEPPVVARRDFDWMTACRKLAELSHLTPAPDQSLPDGMHR